MNINKFVLSIVKRPSFNLLAFQGVTFISLLLANIIVIIENTIIFRYEFASVLEYCFLYTNILAIPVLLYTLIVFVFKSLQKKLTKLIYNKYLTIGNFFIFSILLSITVLREYYGLPADTLASGVLFMAALVFGAVIYSILAFSIIPLIITFIIEQIRGIRIENLPYINNKFKLAGVIFCALFPVVVLGAFAFYLLILI